MSHPKGRTFDGRRFKFVTRFKKKSDAKKKAKKLRTDFFVRVVPETLFGSRRWSIYSRVK